ncbi:hypothetical protein HYX16_01695 [Candidatus Woesearchaeota archaeon]|nr:hypothetical protein [Candidatus Woesearchaeota archaeon]
MKRGLIFILIILLILTSLNAETNDILRVRVNTNILSHEGLTVNLTEFLGKSINYYIVNKPEFVMVNIYPDLGLARLTPLMGKNGTEIIIISTNKELEGTLVKKAEFKDARVEFKDLITKRLNATFDVIVDKALLDYIKKFDIEKKSLKFTSINFSENNLLINLGNISMINLDVGKKESGIVLKNIGIEFFENEEDINYLYYQKEKFKFTKIITNFFIAAFSIILIILLTKLILKLAKRKKFLSKEEFKRAYINKLNILRRKVHGEDLNEMLEEFSRTMRRFLSKMLQIKYQLTFEELIKEISAKDINNKLKKEIINFSREMVEKSYKDKKLTAEDIEKLIENGIDIANKI